MKRRHVVSILVAGAGALVGCRSLRVDGGLYRPSELTATAAAEVPTMTPAPRPTLGKLAYLVGGDVWIKELPVGAARRLTRDGDNAQPRWSPSGAWVAYRRDQTLWLVRASDSDAKPISQMAPSADLDFVWSPLLDGGRELIAYVADAGLFTADPNGPNPRNRNLELHQLVSTLQPSGAVRITRFAWSPDGRWIAYERREERPGEATRSQGVWRVRADRSDLQPSLLPICLSPDPSYLQYRLAGWAPDGQTILVRERVPTSIAEQLDGSPLLQVPINGGAPTRIADAVLADPDFLASSPDGRRLIVVDGKGRETWKSKAIVATEAGHSTRLSSPDRADLFPAISPDGLFVAFSSAPEQPVTMTGGDEDGAMAARRIWRMAADGSGKRQLTSSADARDERPRWSGDGSYILFTRIRNDQGELWLMRADGSEQRQVVDTLTPSPGWFGSFGYVDWAQLYDWWTGPPPWITPLVSVSTHETVVTPVGPGGPATVAESTTVIPTPRDPTLIGRQIAFVGVDDVRHRYPGHSTLWLLRLGSDQPIRMAERDDTTLRPLAWSPDVRSLFIVLEYGKLSVLDLATGGQKLLVTEFGPASIVAVFPSPDGTQLAFSAGCCSGPGTTYLEPSTGGEPTRLTKAPGVLLGWEGTSSRLRFLKDREIVAYDLATSRMDVVRTLPPELGQLFALSPDGRRAVELIFPEKDETDSVRRSDLIVVDLVSGARKNLTNGFVHNVSMPCWSPDGNWLAVTTSPAWTDSAAPQPRRDLWLVRADGSQKLNLTRGKFDSIASPAVWAPVVLPTNGRR